MLSIIILFLKLKFNSNYNQKLKKLKRKELEELQNKLTGILNAKSKVVKNHMGKLLFSNFNFIDLSYHLISIKS